MEKTFLTVGNAEISLDCNIDKIPLVGETTTERGDREIAPGGFGIYTAASIAELGAHSALCACVGGDRYADMLTKFCRGSNIMCDALFADKQMPTAFRLTLTEKSGAKRSAFYPGAYEGIRHSFIEEAFTLRPDAAIASFALPSEHIAYISEMCDLQDIPLFMDAEGLTPAFPYSVLLPCEAVVLDEAQAFRISHIFPDSMDNCLKCAVKLKSVINTKHIVIKLRERGIYVYDGRYCGIASHRGEETFATPHSAEVFISALAYTFMHTKNMEVAAKYAAIALAVYAKKGGGIGALPDADSIGKYCEDNDIY
ncbi:MAG: carbohydrate kinase family protein [Clostridia bacterium]|nr:carbohydrate kinase family protein [Clostridia bacterium]